MSGWYTRAMIAHGLTPILNVSNIRESFAWFERFGWKKHWQWQGNGPFGAVTSGACEIFICENGQGGRGRSALPTTRGPDGNDGVDTGVWMTIWVNDVDEVHRACLANGIEITAPPANEEWGVREMHVRHPDGHVFRVSRGITEHK